MNLLKLLKESVIFAYSALVVNRLRSFLSLLGITIGIFAIISVFTMVDTLENSVRTSVASLGDDVVFIEKWAWGGGGDYPWWKYWQRPETGITDLKELQARDLANVKALCLIISGRRKVEYKSISLTDVSIQAVSEGYDQVKVVNLAEGRSISGNEYRTGKPVTVLGYDIALNLFGTTNCIDKFVKIGGRKVQVIGIFAKEGSSIIGNSMDNVALVPVNFARAITNVNEADAQIMVKAKPGVSTDALKDELTGAMRAIRRIRPKGENNFELNESSIINSQLDGLFSVIRIAGFFIGFLSILVGGFSIANIMFVSVKERTSLIGIQKSLGATNNFILFQFLFEAIFLCIIGGMFGLFLVFICSAIASLALDMNALLSLKNISIGIGSSIIIGLIAGVVPAYFASRLDPVEAIRSN